MSSFCWKTVKSVSGRLLPSVISLPRVTVRRVLWVSCIAKKICRSPGTFFFCHHWMIILEQIFYTIRFKNVFQYAILHFFLFQNSKILLFCQISAGLVWFRILSWILTPFPRAWRLGIWYLFLFFQRKSFEKCQNVIPKSFLMQIMSFLSSFCL